MDLIFAIWTAFAFSANPADPFAMGESYSTGIDGLWTRLQYLLGGRLPVFVLIAIVAFLSFSCLSVRHGRPRITATSVFLGFAFAFGRLSLFRILPSISGYQLFLFLLGGIGFTIFYSYVLVLLQAWFSLPPPCTALPTPIRWIIQHAFIALLILWLPHLILKYPSGFCADSAYQVSQGLGYEPLSMSHPLFHTFLLTFFTRLGLAIGSANTGIFLFSCFQMLLLAAVISWILKESCGLFTPVQQFLLLLFYGLNPYVAGYVGVTIKDSMYIILFLPLQFLLLLYAQEPSCFEKRSRRVAWAASCIFLGLIRHNGLFISSCLCVFFAIQHIKKRHLALFFILLAALPWGIDSLLVSVGHAQRGSAAELLSIPFQQTARTASIFDDATPEEQALISKVLPYDQLSSNYNRYISDPIKSLYLSPSKEELKAYAHVWFRQGLRHPLCYMTAFIEQNAQIFNPEYVNAWYYVFVNTDHYPWKETVFSTPDYLLPFQEKYDRFLNGLHRIPVISALFSASCSMVLLALLYPFLRRAHHAHLILFPLGMCFLYLIFGPTSAYHVRYLFPMIFSCPLLVLYTRNQGHPIFTR